MSSTDFNDDVPELYDSDEYDTMDEENDSDYNESSNYDPNEEEMFISEQKSSSEEEGDDSSASDSSFIHEDKNIRCFIDNKMYTEFDITVTCSVCDAHYCYKCKKYLEFFGIRKKKYFECKRCGNYSY